ncbi:rhodanese-like domain-containing protein [Desulfobacula sp.]
MTRKDLKGMFFLFSFSLIIAFIYNYFSPSGLALFGQWEPSKGVVTANSKIEDVNASIQINNPKIIQEIVQGKKRIILDVRPREIYNQGHLPFALSFPIKEFDQKIVSMLNSINMHSALLVYCASVYCMDSHTVAQRLKSLGYDNIKLFSGGFRQWQEAGYEIEKNEE